MKRLSVMAVVVLGMVAFASPAWAGTFTVTNKNDTGAGSLRQAITDTNDETANPGGDTISFADGLSGEIILQSALPLLSTEIDIQGPGQDMLTVRRSDSAPDFTVLGVTSSGDVSISRLTISGGRGAGGLAGGGIRNNGGTVTISNSTVSNNFASRGGGIQNENGGAMTISGSTISNNTTSGSGLGGGSGGIFNLNGTLNVSDSTISNNSSTDPTRGYGGIYTQGTATISGSTISNNSAPSNGGGISSNGTRLV